MLNLTPWGPRRLSLRSRGVPAMPAPVQASNLHVDCKQDNFTTKKTHYELECGHCGPMPNMMATLPNMIGGALCWTPQFGWRPLLECRAVTLPRCETRWNLQRCPKLANRSQPLVGRSSPYYEDTWRRYCCLTSFFQLSIYALVAKIQPDLKLCDGAKMANFCILYFQWAACSKFQTCILNLHQGHTMCATMTDIQSATVEIRQGKKKTEDRRRNHRAKI